MVNNQTELKGQIIDTQWLLDNCPELKVEYDPSVLSTKSEESELVDYFFDSVAVGDKGIQTLLYELIMYSVIKRATLNKAIILYGSGRNGKSKIFRIIEALLNGKCSYEHLENISGSKAGAKSTIKKLKDVTVNIAEDQKQPKYINISYLTRLISGEPISIEEKGQVRSELVSYATLLFSVNEVINFKEIGLHIEDRFIVIPFNATFTGDERRVDIGDKLCQDKALQIILARAVEAYNEVLKTGKFTIPKSVEDATKNYFFECNNVAEFSQLVPIRTFIFKSTYYKEYQKWCKLNSREAVSSSQFGKQVLSLGYRSERYSFGGNRNTYYAAIDFNNADSTTIYKEYLSYVGLTEEADRAYGNDKKILEDSGKMTFEQYLLNYLYVRLDDVNGDYAKNFMKLYSTSTDSNSNS